MKLLSSLLLLACIAMSTMAQGTDSNVINVKAGDSQSLLNAIEEANRRNADSLTAKRLYILIPDGTYDLGDRVLTTLTGHRVALIGQSMRGTIIQNKPATKDEGISKTATLRLMTSDTYLQDLTLKNALDYYHAGSAGRAVCLHDKGTRTICRRVCMLSYQDTYYTDNVEGQSYLENCDIHGTIDFICGSGDAYFNRCTLVTERRTPDGSGCNVMVAPRTEATPWGYVFESCVVYNRMSEFYYARGWKETPRCIWLNTTLMSPEKLMPQRFDPKGMRTVESYFKEYGTRDAHGRDITPQTNVVTFKLDGEENAVETVMSTAEAKRYQLKKIFPGWRPEKIVGKTAYEADRLKKKYWGER